MSSFMLSFPPSVNGLFNGKQRRFKSDSYKAWHSRFVRTIHAKWHDEMKPGCFVIIEDIPQITLCPTMLAEGALRDNIVKPKSKGKRGDA